MTTVPPKSEWLKCFNESAASIQTTIAMLIRTNRLDEFWTFTNKHWDANREQHGNDAAYNEFVDAYLTFLRGYVALQEVAAKGIFRSADSIPQAAKDMLMLMAALGQPGAIVHPDTHEVLFATDPEVAQRCHEASKRAAAGEKVDGAAVISFNASGRTEQVAGFRTRTPEVCGADEAALWEQYRKDGVEQVKQRCIVEKISRSRFIAEYDSWMLQEERRHDAECNGRPTCEWARSVRHVRNVVIEELFGGNLIEADEVDRMYATKYAAAEKERGN